MSAGGKPALADAGGGNPPGVGVPVGVICPPDVVGELDELDDGEPETDPTGDTIGELAGSDPDGVAECDELGGGLLTTGDGVARGSNSAGVGKGTTLV